MWGTGGSCCGATADPASPNRASDDPEKTNTTYLEDSQPAQGEHHSNPPVPTYQ